MEILAFLCVNACVHVCDCVAMSVCVRSYHWCMSGEPAGVCMYICEGVRLCVSVLVWSTCCAYNIPNHLYTEHANWTCMAPALSPRLSQCHGSTEKLLVVMANTYIVPL